MKKFVRFFSMMVAASTMMMFAACGDEPANGDDPNTPTTYTVTVNCNDATLGTVSISPLQDSYEAGTQVTITATPAATADFVNWNGSITENPYTFTVSENATYTATFQAKPQPTFNATLNGQALDLGWYDAACADLTSQAGSWMWLFQAAQRAEGQSVYFPYIVTYFLGHSTATMSLYAHELYEQTYWEAGDQQYGDWQQYDEGTLNCTAIDLTTHTLSLTMSCTMYYLTDVVQNGAQTDGSDATHAPFAMTLNNIAFELQSKAGFHKMNVRK